MVRKLVLAIAAASALMSSSMVQALGVGEINLRSALNQPLEAEIELLQVRDLTGAEIRPVLASLEDFGRAGIDRSFFLTGLTFTPVVQPNGKAYIRVTSDRPVREPYVSFLMEVRWPSGRVLREFTLLLDPPLYDPAAKVPASTPTQTRSPASAPVARAAPAGRIPTTERQRRTTRADTLWGIALETRPPGSSVHQAMLAIQDLNPNAFIGNNINTLKAGQVLRLPTAEEAAVRSEAEAMAEVNNQTNTWQNRRAAPELRQRQLDARERSVASEAPVQVSGEDSLRIVAASADAGDDAVTSSEGQNGSLRAVLDQTKEQLDSAEQAKSELNDRLADVEGQLETLQRLLALKDAQLAALQRELANEGALPDILPLPENDVAAEGVAQLHLLASSASTEDAESVLNPAQAKLTEIQVEQAGLAELDALTQSESGTEESDQGSAGDDEEQLALAPLVTPADQSDAGPKGSASPATPDAPAPGSTPVAPEAQPSATQSSSPEALWQRFMHNQTLLLATGLIALLVLLLILSAIARRNARREAELSDDYPNRVTGPSAATVDVEGDAFNLALAAVQDEATQDLAVDPLVEADGLIVRDKLSEAADLLDSTEAQPLADESELHDVPLSDGDTADFDFSDFGLEEETAASLADEDEQDIGFDLDFDLDEGPPVEPLAFDEPSLDSAISAEDEYELDLDEDLQAESLLAEFEAMGADEGAGQAGIDSADAPEGAGFTLNDDDLAGFEAQLQAEMQGEYGLGADIQTVDQTDGPEIIDNASPVSEDLMTDGLDEDFDFLSDTDECATKLDLARAYIDMGDEEGARDILSEVVDEGNQQQQQDAREMMEQLG